MSTSVVVTGASGFLGAAVVRACLGARAEVIPVARQAVHGAVRVRSYSEAPRADVLIHLAEDNDRARVAASGAAYEAAAFQTLQALLEKGYGRVVYASSAVLYGGRASSPRKPSDPVHVVDAYTRVKRSSEEAVIGSRGVVARLANLYGAGMSENNVLSTILRQIPGTAPLEVMDEQPVRDFVWIDDAAAAFAAMALRAGKPGIYNVGSGRGVSVSALARAALALAGENDRGVISTRPGEMSSLVLDVAETAAQWQWRPTTPLEEGLARLIATNTEPRIA
jgi:UDP-glucose 4-epimerase